MSLYDTYDNFYKDHPSPDVLGGLNRAQSAKRDKYGRFLPNNDTVLPLPQDHGKSGGQARALKARRDDRGRFVKST